MASKDRDSDAGKSTQPEGEQLPENLKPLPQPDAFKKLPPSSMESGSNRGEVMRPKDKKKKKAGCGCSLVILLLIVVGLIVTSIAWMILPFNKAGYQKQWAPAFDVTEAPAEKTLYLADRITATAATTDTEVGFIARSVELSGTYREDVYVRAVTVHCAPGTVFKKNLEVIAFDYSNEGDVVGELSGKIFRQQGLPEESEP